MGDTQWKRTERVVAQLLNSERNKRGRDFSESMPDVVASFNDIWGIPDDQLGYSCISVECKYRKDQPFIRAYSQNPVTLVGSYLFFNLELFLDIDQLEEELLSTYMTDKTPPKYIHEYYRQAEEYDLKAFPLVVLRMKQNSTLFAYTKEKHIQQLINKLK